MNRKCLLIFSLTLLMASAIFSSVYAEDPASEGLKNRIQTSDRVCAFLDEDGDGFNDLAPDQDGDGIPDRLDPDTKSNHSDDSVVGRWLHFARLFGLMMDQTGWSSLDAGRMGEGFLGDHGLGQGPGQRTGFGPDSDDPTGDGADFGGRSGRRGGHR